MKIFFLSLFFVLFNSATNAQKIVVITYEDLGDRIDRMIIASDSIEIDDYLKANKIASIHYKPYVLPLALLDSLSEFITMNDTKVTHLSYGQRIERKCQYTIDVIDGEAGLSYDLPGIVLTNKYFSDLSLWMQSMNVNHDEWDKLAAHMFKVRYRRK